MPSQLHWHCCIKVMLHEFNRNEPQLQSLKTCCQSLLSSKKMSVGAKVRLSVWVKRSGHGDWWILDATPQMCAAIFPWARFAACVWNRICPRFSLFFFLPLCSPLVSVGWMKGTLMWHSLSVVTTGPRGTRCSLDWLVVQRHIYK